MEAELSSWGGIFSAIVDASAAAAHNVLFVGSVQPVYGVAAVWISFKFVFGLFVGSVQPVYGVAAVWVSFKFV